MLLQGDQEFQENEIKKLNENILAQRKKFVNLKKEY